MSNKNNKFKAILNHPWTIHSLRSLRQFFSVSRSFKAFLTAFKNFPFIGWALLVVDEGLRLTRAALNKKMPLYEQILAFTIGPIKIALGTVGILLPLIVASAGIAVAAPICAMTLALIEAGQAIKAAVESLLKLKGPHSKLQTHLAGHAVANMALSIGVTVATGFLLFFPGAQIIGASIVGALILLKLINFSIQHGKLTKPDETAPQTKDVGTDTADLSEATPPALLRQYEHSRSGDQPENRAPTDLFTTIPPSESKSEDVASLLTLSML